ncbi:hypothetical protein SEVIR_1G173300v4 [Setaria viridis]|nr:putative cyclin-dependent kinase F-2 [Setaria viridis]
MAAAALPAARKRPALDEACPTEAGKKRPRYQLADTGDDNAMPEKIGKGTSIAMELTGPSLRTRLTRPFSESEARDCMRQLLRAAGELHATATIHRDISPDNILVGPDDGGGALKISGFGPAAPAPATMLLGKTYLLEEPPTGSLLYCAPERLFGLRRHGPEVDVWALGCVMAELLAGAPLFTEATEDEMITQGLDLHDEILTMGVGAFDGMGMLDRLSPPGREVLAGLLSFYSDERLTAADALKHPWFAEEDVEAEPPAAAVEAEILGSVPLISQA